jgi:hypothetical protein
MVDLLPPIYNYKFARGDTIILPFQVVLAGSPLNITGAQFWFTAKNNESDPDASAVFQKTLASGITIVDPLTGDLQVTIAPADTSGLLIKTNLYYDLQIKTAGDAIGTIAKGTLFIEVDVTRSTS